MSDHLKYLTGSTQLQARGLMDQGLGLMETLYPKGWEGGLLGMGNQGWNYQRAMEAARLRMAQSLIRGVSPATAGKRYVSASLDAFRPIAEGMGGPSVMGTVKMAPAWLSAAQRAAWDRVPATAERAAAAIRNATGITPKISVSDGNFGRSWYVKIPQRYPDQMERVIRVSDHDAAPRTHQVEGRINLRKSDDSLRTDDELDSLIADLVKKFLP